MSQDHDTTQMPTDVTEPHSDTPLRSVDSPDEHAAAEEDHENPLVTEGDIAADYLEDLLDIADLDGDIDTYVENGRAHVSIVTDNQTLVGADGKVLEALQAVSYQHLTLPTIYSGRI